MVRPKVLAEVIARRSAGKIILCKCLHAKKRTRKVEENFHINNRLGQSPSSKNFLFDVELRQQHKKNEIKLKSQN